MTNAQKTIYDLREVWIKKCDQFCDKSNEVLELGKKKNGNSDPELDEKVAEQKTLSQEAMKALGAYHNACIEYINGLLINYYNDSHIAEMTKQFWEKTKTTEDWYPLMEKADFFKFN